MQELTPALPQPPPLDRHALLKPLPLWQRQYLEARATGSTEREAVRAAHSSEASVGEHLSRSRARVGTHGAYDWDGGRFARAYDAIIEGVVVAGGQEAVREQALEYAGAIVDRFSNMALGQVPEPGKGEMRARDQISAGEKVLQAAKVIGQTVAPPDAQGVARALYAELRAIREASGQVREAQAASETPPRAIEGKLAESDTSQERG